MCDVPAASLHMRPARPSSAVAAKAAMCAKLAAAALRPHSSSTCGAAVWPRECVLSHRRNAYPRVRRHKMCRLPDSGVKVDQTLQVDQCDNRVAGRPSVRPPRARLVCVAGWQAGAEGRQQGGDAPQALPAGRRVVARARGLCQHAHQRAGHALRQGLLAVLRGHRAGRPRGLQDSGQQARARLQLPWVACARGAQRDACGHAACTSSQGGARAGEAGCGGMARLQAWLAWAAHVLPEARPRQQALMRARRDAERRPEPLLQH